MDGLEGILTELAVLGGSVIADSSSTYLMAKKLGSGVESNNTAREAMEKHGAGYWSLMHGTLGTGIRLAAGVALLYWADSQLGIEKDVINMHHAAGYLLSLLKYSAAAGNVARTFGFDMAADIFHAPCVQFVQFSNYLERKYLS